MSVGYILSAGRADVKQRAEVCEFIAGELAAGHWAPNSDFGSHRSAAFSRRLGARGSIGMT
jgi:hypothetical protein